MLIGTYSCLRTVDTTDAEYVRRLRNSPAVARNFQYRYFISDIQQNDFLKSLADSRSEMFFIGERMPAHDAFGVYCLRNIDYRNQRGESGIFLDETVAECAGVEAFEGIYLLLDYAFRYLNLQKICGEVLPENVRAIRFNEAIGMHLEAVRHRHVYYDGDFHDLNHYAMFRGDFYRSPTKIMQKFHAVAASAAPSGSDE